MLGRLFDTVGRKPMIALTYLGSGACAVALALLSNQHALNEWTFVLVVGGTFFLASAGASSAYLTVSEIFPMETRALAIAFFYAVGTAAGRDCRAAAVRQPDRDERPLAVMVAFLIGAAVMAVGGIAELFFGVKAEGEQLEDIAKPLTAEEAEQDGRGEPRREEPEPEPDRARLRRERDRAGPGRHRLGPSSSTGFYSPGMIGTAYSSRERTDQVVDREVERIVAALEEHGPTTRSELAARVGARRRGPGRFGTALRAAQTDGRVRRASRGVFELAK